MPVSLTNDVHSTKATIELHAGDVLSADRCQIIRRKLCGIDGCQCGDLLGLAGNQLGLIRAGLIFAERDDLGRDVVRRG
jgi:hypothetical protein